MLVTFLGQACKASGDINSKITDGKEHLSIWKFSREGIKYCRKRECVVEEHYDEFGMPSVGIARKACALKGERWRL